MYHEKSTILSYFEFVCVDSVSTKVGFNLMGRQPCQVTAIGFMPWALQQVQKDTKVIDRDKNTWMTHPHAFLKKGGELMIDLKPYFAGYNKNPLFTIISDGGVKCEARGDGSYLIHAPRKDGCYTVRVNVIDDDRVSSLTRDFYFVVTSRI